MYKMCCVFFAFSMFFFQKKISFDKILGVICLSQNEKQEHTQNHRKLKRVP